MIKRLFNHVRETLNSMARWHVRRWNHISLMLVSTCLLVERVRYAQRGVNRTAASVPDDRKASKKTDETQQVQKSPAAAVPPFNKRHRGCSFCIMDIENTPLPEFPHDQVVVGVISMEDVIEELLKEEILDETDEYVNIHNRIKVNMSAEKLPTMNSLQQALDASSAFRSAAEGTAGANPGPSTTH